MGLASWRIFSPLPEIPSSPRPALRFVPPFLVGRSLTMSPDLRGRGKWVLLFTFPIPHSFLGPSRCIFPIDLFYLWTCFTCSALVSVKPLATVQGILLGPQQVGFARLLVASRARVGIEECGLKQGLIPRIAYGSIACDVRYTER